MEEVFDREIDSKGNYASENTNEANQHPAHHLHVDVGLMGGGEGGGGRGREREINFIPMYTNDTTFIISVSHAYIIAKCMYTHSDTHCDLPS